MRDEQELEKMRWMCTAGSGGPLYGFSLEGEGGTGELLTRQ